MIANKTRAERRRERYVKDTVIKWSIICSILFVIAFSISYGLILDKVNDRIIQKIVEAESLADLQKEFKHE